MMIDEKDNSDAEFAAGFADTGTDAVTKKSKKDDKDGNEISEDADKDKEGSGEEHDSAEEGSEITEEALEAKESSQEEAKEGSDASGSVEKSASDVTAAVPKPRKITRLTSKEIEDLRALAAEVPKQKEQLSKAFGTIGNLQAQLNGMKDAKEGKGDDAAKAAKAAKISLTPEEVVEQRLRKEAMDDLEEDYPDWRKIVGASETPDPTHPFRKWLATQPEEYQTKINNSNSARTISRAIEKFKASTVPPPKTNQQPDKAMVAAGEKAAAARRDRIVNGVTPKTAGTTTLAKTKTADDEFAEGFASG